MFVRYDMMSVEALEVTLFTCCFWCVESYFNYSVSIANFKDAGILLRLCYILVNWLVNAIVARKQYRSMSLVYYCLTSVVKKSNYSD